MRVISLFTILIICFAVSYAQKADIISQDEVSPDAKALSIFNGDGHKIAKVFGQTRQPKIIVDTVRFAGQYVSLWLNRSFSLGRHSVNASSVDNIFVTVTQLLTDSTKTVNYYAAMPTDGGRRVLIKSSNANDSSKVAVIMIVN